MLSRRRLLFGPWPVDGQVFLTTKLSLGLVNLKPLVPGHVLLIPRRVVPLLSDLTDPETADLFLSARRVGSVLKAHYGARSLTLSVQDGADAGQTVPHVHIHVLPRVPGDFTPNDAVYDELERTGAAQDSFPETVFEEHRKARSAAEMAAEAALMRALLAGVGHRDRATGAAVAEPKRQVTFVTGNAKKLDEVKHVKR